MSNQRRFSGKQITIMVVAICVAIVGAPVTVMAATGSGINIVDPTHATQKAAVTAKASLVTSERDPVTGAYARVDGGSLRVGGTVAIGAGTPLDLVTNNYINGGSYGNTQNVLVPSGGHYAVVQSISGAFSMNTTGAVPSMYVLWTGPNNVSHVLNVPGIRTRVNSFGLDFYSISMDVTMYVKPGTNIQVQFGDSDSNGASATVNLQGMRY
jgi:hypothetical protein